MYLHLINMSRRALRETVSVKRIPPGSASDTVAGLARQLVEPSVTFHGAPRRVIGSIVRYGFVIPGEEIGRTGMSLEVRCGSTFGKGIYSSPDPMYASHYLDYQDGKTGLSRPSDIPGMRLIVCSTLMGRAMTASRGAARGKLRPSQHDVHSHVGHGGCEYVVFSSSQIIPCYVLHLDYGVERAKRDFVQIAANPQGSFSAAKEDNRPRSRNYSRSG